MKQNPFDTLASEYESWFVENKVLFQSELLALRQVVPVGKKGIEIGVAVVFLLNNSASDLVSTPRKIC